LGTFEREIVQVMAMKLQGKLIAISFAQLRAIPVVKFNSWWIKGVVCTANNDTTWQEEYIHVLEGIPTTDISFEDKAHSYKGKMYIPDDLQLVLATDPNCGSRPGAR
jgi:hypothetical protein